MLVNFIIMVFNINGDFIVLGMVLELVGLSSMIDISGEVVVVFDFNIVDGSGDGLFLFVFGLDFFVSGLMSVSDCVKIIWLLNGLGVIDVVGLFNGLIIILFFSSLGIMVVEGGINIYMLSVYYNDNIGLIDGLAVVFFIDGDMGFVVGGVGM